VLRPDDLVRRIYYERFVKLGAVKYQAFNPSARDIGQGISVHSAGSGLTTTEEVNAYIDGESGLGRRLGYCMLPRSEVSKVPGLEVTHSDVDGDALTHLHHLISSEASPDNCPTEAERRELAKIATVRGDFVCPIEKLPPV